MTGGTHRLGRVQAGSARLSAPSPSGDGSFVARSGVVAAAWRVTVSAIAADRTAAERYSDLLFELVELFGRVDEVMARSGQADRDDGTHLARTIGHHDDGVGQD